MEVHHRYPQSPPLDTILSQFYSPPIFTTCNKVHIHVTFPLPCPSKCTFSRSSHQNSLCIHCLLYPSYVVSFMSLSYQYCVCHKDPWCVKVKVNLFLCFNWAPRHEGVLREWMCSSNHSLTSPVDGGEWSASRLGRFTPKERAPVTHWIEGWVGSISVLDAVVKRKIPSSFRESNSRTSIVQPVA
jgi:hypothetical protein